MKLIFFWKFLKVNTIFSLCELSYEFESSYCSEKVELRKTKVHFYNGMLMHINI